MGLGLAVVVAGIVALVSSTGAARPILAVGIGVYLVGVVITVAGIVLVYRDVPPPRPNFFNLRWALLHDAVHARSANTEQWAEVPGPLGAPPQMDDLRQSHHWRPAVWGVRVMGPALAVVIAGLVTLVWSSAAGKVVLAVGIGVYLVVLVFTLLEGYWALGDVNPPRPNYARVRRTALHDALHRSGPSSLDSRAA